MFHKLSFALCAVAAVLISVPARASDLVFPGGGTLAQIMDGGGTNTIFTIVNLDSITAPYQLSFYGDDGQPLTLSTTAGKNSSLSGTLGPNGTIIIQTNGGGGAVLQGYAVLSTGQISGTSTGSITSLGNQVAGSAVFGLPLATGTFAQASCPLDTGADFIFEIPFDETGGATSAQTGVAIANSFFDAIYQPLGTGETALIRVTIRDQNGNQIPAPAGQAGTINLPFGAHTSFMLDDPQRGFPQIVGHKGTVVFQAADLIGIPYVIKVLGLRATGSTLTSITPIIPCNLKVNPATGQLAGCSN
jgi:hypothetical protein